MVSTAPGVRQRKSSLEALRNALPEDEPIVAVGTATGLPLVVTTERIARWGHDRAVSIPLSRVTAGQWWMQAHRWSVRLIHGPIDPNRRPSDAHQWWRWHDRRADRRATGRAWTETVFHFSREDTHAARAIRRQLADRGLPCQRVGPPTQSRPNAWGMVGRIVFGPWQAWRFRRYRASRDVLRLRHE